MVVVMVVGDGGDGFCCRRVACVYRMRAWMLAQCVVWVTKQCTLCDVAFTEWCTILICVTVLAAIGPIECLYVAWI